MQKLSHPFEHFEITAQRMANPGILLMSGRQGNPMTIGWAQLGIIWGKPIMTVLVRPSRYSHELLENLNEFSVNVLPEGAGKILGFCGSRSGRELDKIAECGLTTVPGRDITVPSCGEAELIYECRVVAKQELPPGGLLSEIPKGYYPEGDYHTLYHGEVLGAYGAF